MKRREFLALGAVLPLVACVRDRLDAAALSSPLAAGTAVFDELKAPGTAVALLPDRADPSFLLRGVEDLSRVTPVGRSTVFQIASLTKPFTAMVLLMLVEEGRIALDEPAGKWISWLPDAYSGVTVRHLLNHISGVPRDVRRENIDEFTIEEFRTRFLAASPSFKPGEKWEYANAGYTLLTFIIEAAGKESFGQLLEKRIFRPLGMRNTHYRALLSLAPGRATGYDWQEGAWRQAPLVYSGWGGSGIETTIENLALFGRALQGRSLLRSSSYDEMLRPARLANGTELNFPFRGGTASYGFGWFLSDGCGQKLAFHGGAVAGFSSQLQWALGSNLMVAALANGKSTPDRFGVAEKIAAPIFRTALGCT